jgi:hypothetical protein
MKTGIHMTDLHKNAPSHEGPPTSHSSHDRNRKAEFAAQADLTLARYPAEVREQIIDLLQVLAERPGDADSGVR